MRTEIDWIGWRKLLGVWDVGERGWRAKWGEVSWDWGLGLNLILFSSDVSGGGRYSLMLHLFYPKFFIKLAKANREPSECMGDYWGFTLVGRSVHLHWGRRTKVVDFPWDWRQVKHEVQLADGSWGPYEFPWRGNVKGNYDGRYIRETPYRYVRRSGEVQTVTASYYVERRTIKWRWLRWLPYLRRTSTSISVDFSSEIGEGTGSWKGGTVGCGYEVMRGEHPTSTLRRMENERRFER